MWPFGNKAEKISKKLSSCFTNELVLNVEAIAEIYRTDSDLSERFSVSTVANFQLELIPLLYNFALVVLLNNRSDDIATKSLADLHNYIISSIDTRKFFPDIPVTIHSFLDDRMPRYSAVVNGHWRAAAYWWFGADLPDDLITQCLALFGDYVTYTRIMGRPAIGDEIEPAMLISPLDCEAAFLPAIINRLIRTNVSEYIKTLSNLIT